MKKMLIMCLAFGAPLYGKPLTYRVEIHNKLNEPIILQERDAFHIKRGRHEVGAGQNFKFGLQLDWRCYVSFKRKVEETTIGGYGEEYTGEYSELVCNGTLLKKVYSDYDIEADSNNKDKIKVRHYGKVRGLSN